MEDKFKKDFSFSRLFEVGLIVILLSISACNVEEENTTKTAAESIDTEIKRSDYTGQYHHVDGCLTCHAANLGDSTNVALIREVIETPNSGPKPVVFTSRTGANSFADGDGNYNGPCEVCHTMNKHHNNDGHDNTTHMDGAICTQCHKHNKQFAPPTLPYVQSHETHLLADQAKGPTIGCKTCHNDPSIDPLVFADMKPLATTTVCDTCHSPGGTYPGVDGLMNATLGAKANFKTGGIYNEDRLTLRTGKEKWCATCHDEEPSVINGVTAPNTIGNESASYTYGTGYGFYKTGHGVSSSSTFPYSGGTVNGPGIGCTDCHTASRGHIDGIARTYGADRTTGGGTFSPYRDGYRLKDVGGNPPMQIPFEVDTYPFEFLAESAFALCFSCHSFAKFQIDDLTTRFRRGTINAHAAHFGQYPKATIPVVPGEEPAGGTYWNLYWKSAWSSSPANDSRITCVTCHNVHGSTQLGMIRDGKLIGQDQGIPIRYYNNASTSFGAYGTLPVPDTLTLDQSTGYMVDARYIDQVCSNCHGGSWDSTTPSPWDR